MTREEITELSAWLGQAHHDLAHALVVRVIRAMLWRLVQRGALTPDDVRAILTR